jgi:peptide/nickel transport system permease protein
MRGRLAIILKAIGKSVLLFAAFMLSLSILVFWLARLAPGDPLSAFYGEAAERISEAQRAATMDRLSLDKPLPLQYAAWLRNALSGDFGISLKYRQSVSAVIGSRLVNTLLLGGFSWLLTFLCAIPLGVFCAAREGGLPDRLICRIGTAAGVIPGYFMAMSAIYIFGVRLRLFPTGGAYSIGGGGLIDRAAHLILPIGTLILSHLWYYAGTIRNRVAEELGRDYVLLLRVKRISQGRILLLHCLRNALPTLLAAMTASVSHIIAGTYVVETAFGYPGLGTLVFESARHRDYNMLSALTLLTGCLILACSLTGQTLSELFDRRMRHEEAAKGDAGG